MHQGQSSPTTAAAVVWDQRYSMHIQRYAEATPLDALGFTAALGSLEHTLHWAGEIVAQIPTQTLALLQERLFAEASTAAWQDYFFFNALMALLSIFPALPFWRSLRLRVPTPVTPQNTAVSNGATAPDGPVRSHTDRARASTSNGAVPPPPVHGSNPTRRS